MPCTYVSPTESSNTYWLLVAVIHHKGWQDTNNRGEEENGRRSKFCFIASKNAYEMFYEVKMHLIYLQAWNKSYMQCVRRETVNVNNTVYTQNSLPQQLKLMTDGVSGILLGHGSSVCFSTAFFVSACSLTSGSWCTPGRERRGELSLNCLSRAFFLFFLAYKLQLSREFFFVFLQSLCWVRNWEAVWACKCDKLR